MLEEYRPEAASLSADVLNALESAVGSLVNEGEHVSACYSAVLTSLKDGKVDDTSLVPLVFVAHLVEEISSHSPFITNIGCEQPIVEGTPSHLLRDIPLIACRFSGKGS